MKFKTYNEFLNESVNNNDTVIIITTSNNKEYKYTRNDIQQFINNKNDGADDLPKWLFVHYIEEDKRSKNPHRTSKSMKDKVINKLKTLIKHTGEPEKLNLK